MDLIQARTGDSTKVQSSGYVDRAKYVLSANRDGKASATSVQQERERLRARVAASWDEYRQRSGQPPLAHWGQVCWGLDQYALAYSNRVFAAKQAQYERERAAARAAQQTAPSAPSASSSSGSSGGGYSVPSASTADADRARAEHQQTMQRYQRENNQIRQEIRAIDRKYR